MNCPSRENEYERIPYLRWLHCSDFHIGSDRTAQERLLDKIVGHVADQVSKGFVPDLIFITGDLADRFVPPAPMRFTGPTRLFAGQTKSSPAA